MIVRLAVTSAAIVLCAWFVLGAIQARDLSRATKIVQNSGSLGAKQAARVESLLSDAATLNPDRTVSLLRGLVEQDRGRRRQAIQTFEQVARAEPMNVEAWVYLAQAALGDDALVRRAVVQVGILDSGAKLRR